MLLSGTAIMALSALMGMADPLIAGILLGEEAVAGVSLVLPVYSLAGFFGVCLSYGVPILYSGEIGAFRREEADRCFGVGLLITSAAGVLSFLALLFGGAGFLRLYGAGGEIRANAEGYLFWMKFVILLLPLNELLDGMVFADGDEAVSLASNLLQGFLKLALSVPLCRRMGTRGLALASFLSFALANLVLTLHFFRKGNSLRLNLAFSPKVFRSILRYGVVDAGTYLFISLFSAIVNAYVIAAFGPRALVLTAVITLVREVQLVFDGIGQAITPIVGTYLGERTYPGVRKVWKLAQRSVRTESLLVTALLFVLAPPIVGLLGIEDPLQAREAAWGLRLISLTQIFACRMYLDSSVFILAGKIPLGVFDTFLRELFPALPLAVLGGRIGGVWGMFAGVMLSPVLGYLLSWLYVCRRYGRENYPLFLADKEREGQRELFEFRVAPGSVVQIRDRIGGMLRENACPEPLTARTMLLFEELFMLICENNPGRTVLAECCVELEGSVRLITKDDGAILDLMNADSGVSSLRSYVTSSLLDAHTSGRVHFLALSCNRNVLEVR